jgi:hypothetical protein
LFTTKSVQSAQERLQAPLISGGKSLQGVQVVRPSGQLRLHPVLLKLNLVGTLINYAVHGRKPEGSIPEPILITSGGIIVSGVREWHTAVTEGRPALSCTEYQLRDDEALQLILMLQQSRGAWNAFTRIEIALQHEPYLQARARANQVVGGANKGLANLPEAKQLDVRQEIAYLAGACPRNVSKVKSILDKGHPRLIEACRSGLVTVHRALQICRLPENSQVEGFSRYLNERSSGKTTRQSIATLGVEKIGPKTGFLLRTLLQRESREPNSIVVRAGTRKQTVIFVGREDWANFAAFEEDSGNEL